MKKILIIAVVLFTACSSGPQVVNEYHADKSKRSISLDKNQLGGSYWENANPHTLQLNFEVEIHENGKRNFLVTVVYFSKGRAFKKDNIFLELMIDQNIYKIDDLFYIANPREKVTQKRSTGEIVEHHNYWFEYAVFTIDQSLLTTINNSNSVKVNKLGIMVSPDWYFNVVNFQKFREFYNQCQKYLNTNI